MHPCVPLNLSTEAHSVGCSTRYTVDLGCQAHLPYKHTLFHKRIFPSWFCYLLLSACPQINTSTCCSASTLSYSQGAANSLSLSPPEEKILRDLADNDIHAAQVRGQCQWAVLSLFYKCTLLVKCMFPYCSDL